MGENKHIKELNAFTKKYVKDIKEEQPSFNFTASIMNALETQEEKVVVKPTVLISRKVWFLIAAIFVAIIFIPFKQSEKSFIEIPQLDFSMFDKFQFSSILNSISISNITYSAVLLFGLMVIVQVIFLKNHFEKRIE
jgi:capsular polysaccharide biosynthesis protein